VAGALTATHPNRKARYLHSWLAATWVAAGAGLAGLLYGRRSHSWAGARPWLGGAALAGLAWANAPALLAPGRAAEGGPQPDQPSLLDVTDSYLPELDGGRRVIVLGAVPIQPLAQWTFLTRYGTFERLEERWYGFAGPGADNRAGFLAWLGTTDCDTLVFIDRADGPLFWEEVPEVALHAELRDLLREQQTFRLVKAEEYPRQACRLTVWKRR
jgi:hypothetical protein